jgi:hypothetical protein
MVKVNVAQYVIHDLLNRFTLNNEMLADEDIIDALVDKWSKDKYVTPHSLVKINHARTHNQHYLM